MTVTGSSAQYDEIKSVGAAGSSASSSSCAIASARVRNCSTARTVNTRLTSLRYRVWSGGSVASSDGGSSGCSTRGVVRSSSRPSALSALTGLPVRKSGLDSTSFTVAWSTVR
jgi:hypothetical protein